MAPISLQEVLQEPDGITYRSASTVFQSFKRSHYSGSEQGLMVKDASCGVRLEMCSRFVECCVKGVLD